MDKDDSARPQRRTALVAKELSRYNIDIAALSETRLADEGSLQNQPVATPSFGKERLKARTGYMGLASPSKQV